MAESGYSGTPLAKKLGIKAGQTVALLDAPATFRAQLTDLPDEVRFVTAPTATADLTLWFLRSAKVLEARAAAVSMAMGRGLWILWPKKTSGLAPDLSEHAVRAAGLTQGLVDYKVCAVDAIWSGLKFARRLRRSGPR